MCLSLSLSSLLILPSYPSLLRTLIIPSHCQINSHHSPKAMCPILLYYSPFRESIFIFSHPTLLTTVSLTILPQKDSPYPQGDG